MRITYVEGVGIPVENLSDDEVAELMVLLEKRKENSMVEGEKMIERARTEYASVLRLPFNSYERTHNQDYMAFLRDFIAEHEGRDAETVQTEYEQPAFDDISRSMFGGTMAELRNNPNPYVSPPKRS